MNEKVRLTINGQSIEVDAGTTVFQAAAQAGIFIPHYCYHPDLSIAGVCRMCMVDIEKAPKPQISCNTIVTPGMVVRTDTDKVKEIVKNVLELHLINHPLDCPICDKAGECKLQDFYVKYGLYQSRMELEKKVHKPKVVDIGTIVLDSERCILCTRCVRFTGDVTQSYELGIFNRGDRSELRTYDNGPLKNDYTGNLADICPVGALTAKDFRFQQRVWFLEKTASVCHLCAHGCSTQVSVNPDTNQLYRVEPRRNPDVNKSWICDTGRWDYHYLYDQKRLVTPREYVDGQITEVPWASFFSYAKAILEKNPKEIWVMLSAQLTNEEVWESVETFKSFGVEHFGILADEKAVTETKPYDGILKHHDETPNYAGAERVFKKLGVKNGTHPKASYLWIFGVEGTKMPGLGNLVLRAPKNIEIILHATNTHGAFERCRFVLPNVSSFEKSGSFVSALGRVQKLQASLQPRGASRNLHAVLAGLRHGDDKHVVSKKHVQECFTKTSGLLGITEKSWSGFPELGVGL